MKRHVPHTPGPWRTGKGGADRVYVDRGPQGSYPLAQVMSRPDRSAAEELLDLKSEEDFANARLMAAAPALLEALRHARHVVSAAAAERRAGAAAALDDIDAALRQAVYIVED